MTPEEFITEARLWIGTPFHHQASLKGIGADCVGFPKGVIEKFAMDVSSIPKNYSRNAQPEILINYLKNSSIVIEDNTKKLKAGRIALFIVYKEPHHFGIITDIKNGGTWIHADVNYGVVETPMGKWMQRIHSIWIPIMLEEENE